MKEMEQMEMEQMLYKRLCIIRANDKSLRAYSTCVSDRIEFIIKMLCIFDTLKKSVPMQHNDCDGVFKAVNIERLD